MTNDSAHYCLFNFIRWKQLLVIYNFPSTVQMLTGYGKTQVQELALSMTK